MAPSPVSNHRPGSKGAHDARKSEEGPSASAAKQYKTRKRNGSLRKTALLTTGTLRRSLDAESASSASDPRLANLETLEDSATTSQGHQSTIYDEATTSVLDSDKSDIEADGSSQTSSGAVSPVINPPSHPDASTTDDDDQLSFSGLPASTATHFSRSASVPAVQHRRSNKSVQQASSHPSPHGGPPTVMVSSDDDWDYTETEWWGWVVLFVTWIVFVIGMGSCLGVWSWAWDVGETPYAPPELEDDPSLPIVGYYPALIIMTAVMAWVWVVVAWVGMKSFRHAKMVGEDG